MICFKHEYLVYGFLATFGDDERLRALRQRAEGRRVLKILSVVELVTKVKISFQDKIVMHIFCNPCNAIIYGVFFFLPSSLVSLAAIAFSKSDGRG